MNPIGAQMLYRTIEDERQRAAERRRRAEPAAPAEMPMLRTSWKPVTQFARFTLSREQG